MIISIFIQFNQLHPLLSIFIHVHPFLSISSMSYSLLWLLRVTALGPNINSGNEPRCSMPVHIHLIHLRLLWKNISAKILCRTAPECQLFRMWSKNLRHLPTEMYLTVGSFVYSTLHIHWTLVHVARISIGSKSFGPKYLFKIFGWIGPFLKNIHF